MTDMQKQNMYNNLISKFNEDAAKLSEYYIDRFILLNSSDEGSIEEFTKTGRDWIDDIPDFCQVMADYNGLLNPSAIFVSTALQQAMLKNKYLVINDENKNECDDDLPF